ncbi:MAG: SOS response-associated peptidase [Nitrospirales bacterium]
MCGRYTQKEKFDNLLKLLQVARMPQLKPRYNVAPTQMVACVRNAPENDYRECTRLKWGLIPSWAKEASIGNTMINARGETVAEKPSFRKAFQLRRCLLLADGFYEWKREGEHKHPYYIRFQDQRPFAFAGLWEQWPQTESRIESCTLITTNANALMTPIHHRMPVILAPQDFDVWLDPATQDPTLLMPLLSPYSSDEMEAYPVNTLVNNPQNDLPECVTPL